MSALWRVGRDRTPAIVHLHWLEFIAAGDDRGCPGWLRTLRRQLRLVAALLWLRARGVGIVWTVHNLAPHEPIWPSLEHRLFRAVLLLSHRAIAHSEYARDRIASTYGHAGKVRTIAHGNYIDAHPTIGDRSGLRRTWGVGDDAFVFLVFGQVRPYKQIAELVETFGGLEGDRLRLVVAGRPVLEHDGDRLRRLAVSDPRVILELRRIDDSEVSTLHAAADAAVIAYRDVFSSGALLLALSLGLPVVAPVRGTAGEIAQPPALEGFEPGGLAAALHRIAEAGPDRGQRRRAARDAALQYPWEAVGRSTVEVYREARRAAGGAV